MAGNLEKLRRPISQYLILLPIQKARDPGLAHWMRTASSELDGLETKDFQVRDEHWVIADLTGQCKAHPYGSSSSLGEARRLPNFNNTGGIGLANQLEFFPVSAYPSQLCIQTF